MILIPDGERRQAFSVWLRTGRLPVVTNAGELEVKFNPWHDPEDGRFTFAGAGRYYGAGGSGRFRGGGGGSGGGGGATAREDWPRQPATNTNRLRSGQIPIPKAKAPTSPPRPSLPKARAPRLIAKRGWGGTDFTGGGGGGFGGGGASSSEPWGDSPPRQRPASKAPAASADRPTSIPKAKAIAGQRPGVIGVVSVTSPLHREIRNGYEYQIDDRGRTRIVSGALTLAKKKVRSRTAQGQAGGDDRRSADDGGHYIAARFNGPTEAFNHFAQDANFNRGRYRVLEDQWAMEKRAGKRVTVRIVPTYHGASKRPAVINIWFTIKGREESIQFPNEPKEKLRGK